MKEAALSRYAEIKLCREMGWSYNDLVEAPAEFIEDLLVVFEGEAERRKHES